MKISLQSLEERQVYTLYVTSGGYCGESVESFQPSRLVVSSALLLRTEKAVG